MVWTLHRAYKLQQVLIWCFFILLNIIHPTQKQPSSSRISPSISSMTIFAVGSRCHSWPTTGLGISPWKCWDMRSSRSHQHRTNSQKIMNGTSLSDCSFAAAFEFFLFEYLVFFSCCAWCLLVRCLKTIYPSSGSRTYLSNILHFEWFWPPPFNNKIENNQPILEHKFISIQPQCLFWPATEILIVLHDGEQYHVTFWIYQQKIKWLNESWIK